MKISFFIGSLRRGGAERVISILANDYCARGWDVDIVLLLQNEVDYPLDAKINIVDITSKGGSYFKNALPWLSGIRRYLKAQQPDCVVSFVGRINALVLTAATGLKRNIVVSERNDPKHDGRGALMQWYCNRVYRRARAIVYQNEHEKSCFNAALASKGYIIPNPVQVRAERHDNAGTDIITAGRLTEQKNQAMLLRAMARIHQEHPDIKCRIFGEGNLRGDLQEQIRNLGLENTVFLEGNVANIYDRLAQSGLFVLTSNFEGLSNALIEAMMVGLPCITTDYPGARELIVHGQNGIVVPMDDDAELAAQIEKLLLDKAYAAQLSHQGKQDSQKFKAETVLAQWHNVIEG